MLGFTHGITGPGALHCPGVSAWPPWLNSSSVVLPVPCTHQQGARTDQQVVWWSHLHCRAEPFHLTLCGSSALWRASDLWRGIIKNAISTFATLLGEDSLTTTRQTGRQVKQQVWSWHEGDLCHQTGLWQWLCFFKTSTGRTRKHFSLHWTKKWDAWGNFPSKTTKQTPIRFHLMLQDTAFALKSSVFKHLWKKQRLERQSKSTVSHWHPLQSIRPLRWGWHPYASFLCQGTQILKLCEHPSATDKQTNKQTTPQDGKQFKEKTGVLGTLCGISDLLVALETRQEWLNQKSHISSRPWTLSKPPGDWGQGNNPHSVCRCPYIMLWFALLYWQTRRPPSCLSWITDFLHRCLPSQGLYFPFMFLYDSLAFAFKNSTWPLYTFFLEYIQLFLTSQQKYKHNMSQGIL